jgi:hypothetical protein
VHGDVEATHRSYHAVLDAILAHKIKVLIYIHIYIYNRLAVIEGVIVLKPYALQRGFTLLSIAEVPWSYGGHGADGGRDLF